MNLTSNKVIKLKEIKMNTMTNNELVLQLKHLKKKHGIWLKREFTYHPDFLADGRLYEVKGDQFFRIDESGHEVMVNPYRNPEWSDEQYEWECGKYEAKHQCMLKNNVIILRESQIENLDSVFNYGKQKETEARVKHTCVDA